MKVLHKGVDITEIVTKLEWSGDYKQVARKLNFGIAVSPHDYYLKRVTILMGDMVRVLDDDDKEIFQGYVFSKDKSINNSEMQLTVYDGLIYLLKSKGTYNFKNMTPDAITRKVANDFGIELGTLESGSPLFRIFDAESIYNIIMTAYTIESQASGRLFMPKMKEGKLNVILKGNYTAKFELDAKSTIINSSYGESIENSINKVKIYDKEGNEKGEVNLGGVPGILQDIYKEEEGVDATTAATAMLKGIEKTASIEALGDFECITGNAVIIKEPFTGLSGLFYIDNDVHTFENGQHTMSLGLSFQNIMDSQTGGQDPFDVSASSGGKGEVTGTGKQRVWNFLKAKGFSNEAAAAIMGNLQQESGIDPTKKQYGGGPGRGIMQWELGSDRFQALEALARKRGTTWEDLDTQLEFMWYEFNNERTAVNKLRNKYGMTPKDLMKMKDTNRAVTIFEDCYERAGNKQLGKRQSYANQMLKQFKDTDNVKGGTSNVGGSRGSLIKAAESMLGFSYSQKNRFGASSADCSSLVGRAMKAAEITNDAQLTTRSIQNDSRFTKISKSQLQPGDIVWEKGHMALFIGNNKLIEASSSAKKVRYANLGNRFTHGYRIKGI